MFENAFFLSWHIKPERTPTIRKDFERPLHQWRMRHNPLDRRSVDFGGWIMFPVGIDAQKSLKWRPYAGYEKFTEPVAITLCISLVTMSKKDAEWCPNSYWKVAGY